MCSLVASFLKGFSELFLHFEAVVDRSLSDAGAQVVLRCVVSVEFDEYRSGGGTLSVVLVVLCGSMSADYLRLCCIMGWGIKMSSKEVGHFMM